MSLVYSTDFGRACPGCGQPAAQCTCKAKVRPAGDGIVRVRRETAGRKGKGVTAIHGLPPDDAALTALAKACAGFARMSGSGATCFGLFETGNVAKRAAAALRSRHPNWFVAATRSIASDGPVHG